MRNREGFDDSRPPCDTCEKGQRRECAALNLECADFRVYRLAPADAGRALKSGTLTGRDPMTRAELEAAVRAHTAAKRRARHVKRAALRVLRCAS